MLYKTYLLLSQLTGLPKKKKKKRIYKTILWPVIMYGAEACTLTKIQEELMQRWERNILKKINGSVEDGIWTIRQINEIRSLFREPGTLFEIKKDKAMMVKG